MTRTVLVGAAGSGTAFGAISAVRRAWGSQVRIVAIDANPAHLVTANLLADAFETVPYVEEPDFREELLRIITEQRVTIYLPLVPAEIAFASRLIEGGDCPHNLHVMAPSAFAGGLCNDKLKLYEFLASRGIAVPRSAAADAPFGGNELFAKPRSGFGGRFARKLTSGEVAELSHEEKASFVVQEICFQPEVTVDCFVDPSRGFHRSLSRERIDVKAGVSAKCRIFESEELDSIALRLSEALDLKGTFCFQVMHDADGRVVVTDVNARPGAGTSMCWTTGNDFHAANFARCWDEPYEQYFRPVQGSIFVTRQYADFLTGTAP